jgi:hypothetical protein
MNILLHIYFKFKFGPDKFFCARYNYFINLHYRGDDYR